MAEHFWLPTPPIVSYSARKVSAGNLCYLCDKRSPFITFIEYTYKWSLWKKKKKKYRLLDSYQGTAACESTTQMTFHSTDVWKQTHCQYGPHTRTIFRHSVGMQFLSNFNSFSEIEINVWILRNFQFAKNVSSIAVRTKSDFFPKTII